MNNEVDLSLEEFAVKTPIRSPRATSKLLYIHAMSFIQTDLWETIDYRKSTQLATRTIQRINLDYVEVTRLGKIRITFVLLIILNYVLNSTTDSYT